MRDEPGRGLVLARALTLAGTSVAVSALAHVLAGGQAAPGPVLAIGALQLAAASLVARRPLTAGRVAAWAVATQLLTHVALAWLHPGPGTAVAVPGHHGLEQAHAALGAGAAHAIVPAGPARWTMLAAHLLGTVVVVALASGADRAATAVRSRWAVVLDALAPRPAPARARLLVHASARAASGAAPLRHSVVRRGPPAAAIA
jgi:hypothetical protein